jgi:two-component system, NarL family, captular synthesis response regulator RcsB
MKIKKVLIAEDQESANLSVQVTLKELDVASADYVYYCDDALVRIQKALTDSQPYDLLITDLSFEADHREQAIKDGQTLIAAARKAQPDLGVLVFSVERRVAIVETLYNTLQIDGYVRKARNDAKDLAAAIERIRRNERYTPWWYVEHLKHREANLFEPVDMAIITLLAQGIRQKEMSEHLKQLNIRRTGLSKIEKRLKRMREALGFANNEQLVAHCKDRGIV